VSYLLSHRSRNNDDTLQYLLDPRRCGRGWGRGDDLLLLAATTRLETVASQLVTVASVIKA
jgi:hypothetical protein